MEKLRINVLVFPGGNENGLEIARSLKYCKEVRLFSVSSSVPNQAMYEYIHNDIIPDVRDGVEWIEKLNAVIAANRIDIIIPANSVVIDYLNSNREKLGCDILLPAKNVISMTRSKKLTIQKLEGIVEVPKVYHSLDDVKKEDFPLFAKPDRGYGGVGTLLLKELDELGKVDFDACIVEEYLPGKEYTIDCFSTTDRLLFCSGRERQRIRMGTTMHCESLSGGLQDQFYSVAEKIHKEIPIEGFWFFQMKEDGAGIRKLLEIDIRIAGTMCFHRCMGVNFPLLGLFNHYGYPIKIHPNKVAMSMDRCLKSSYRLDYYYETVYTDLDGTIIIHEKLNLQMVMFLYQCINEGKKIILLTKNHDKSEYLRELKIYDVFDRIYWLDEQESKADYIKDRKAIFIDDSFTQRMEVEEKCRILTFDPSMIECLINERS